MRYDDPTSKILNNFILSATEKLLTGQPLDMRKENTKANIDVLCELFKSYAPQNQEVKDFLDCQAKLAKQNIDNQK